VIGSLELMQTVEMDPELEQYQQTAAGSARDMMRMVNGILTLTELQAGKLKATDDIQPARVVEALRAVRRQRGEQVAGLQGRGAPGPAGPLARRQQNWRSAWNACWTTRSSSPGRWLALRVTGKPSSLTAGAVLCGDRHRHRLYRSGRGDLYQRFFQLDGSMTREYGGLGVAGDLPAVGGVARRTLTHRSEPGRGSRFQLDVEFELPASNGDGARPGFPAPAPAAGLHGVAGGRQQRQSTGDARHVAQGFRVRTADSGRRHSIVAA
jgi:hypothetical protein